jgi:Skp family chaperone for outer membrane proteins
LFAFADKLAIDGGPLAKSGQKSICFLAFTNSRLLGTIPPQFGPAGWSITAQNVASWMGQGGLRHKSPSYARSAIVKSFFYSATVVAVLLTIYAVADAQAQRGAAGPPPQVAVVDVSYVFKHHTRFQGQMEAMKKDVEQTEETLKKERDRITKLMEKMKDYKPGTPDYNKLEEDITHMQADFNARAALQKKEILERESKVYMGVYREVSDAVKYYAERNGIAMVLRFNGDPVDPNNRESILREINKPIVFQRDVDITPIILDDLNRNAAGGGGDRPADKRGGRPGVPPRN